MSTTRRIQDLAVRAHYLGFQLVRVHERAGHPYNHGIHKLGLRRPNGRATLTGTVDQLEAWLDTQEEAA